MNSASWGQQNFETSPTRWAHQKSPSFIIIKPVIPKRTCFSPTKEFLLELNIRARLTVLNKASQNAFVKLNKAVEVSNGVEIITVALAGL